MQDERRVSGGKPARGVEAREGERLGVAAEVHVPSLGEVVHPVRRVPIGVVRPDSLVLCVF